MKVILNNTRHRLRGEDVRMLESLRRRHAAVAQKLADPHADETRQYVEERLAALEARMAEIEGGVN